MTFRFLDRWQTSLGRAFAGQADVLAKLEGRDLQLEAHLDDLGKRVLIVCTESTRPTSPAAGTTIFETDTRRTLLHDGTGWIIMDEPVQTYEPTWSSDTIGSGGLSRGRYWRSGGKCWFAARFDYGSGSAVGTYSFFSLPIGSGGERAFYEPAWGGRLWRHDGTSWVGQANSYDSTTGLLMVLSAAGALQHITATNPMTWANGDYKTVSGWYVMADRYS